MTTGDNRLSAATQTDILLFLAARNGEKYPDKQTLLAAIKDGFGVELTAANLNAIAKRLRRQPTDFYETGQGRDGGPVMSRVARLERVVAELFRKLGEVPSEPLG